MENARYDVVGIGNAIVDVLARIEDDLLETHGLIKGSMTLVDADQAEALYAEMTGTVECSGGSAANTMVGLASFGGRAAYIGKVRDDKLGRVFSADIAEAGVEFPTLAAAEGSPTGRCLVLVSADAQRTMQTFLGISAELAPSDVDSHTIAAANVTYLEGYLWDPPPAKQAFLCAAEIAHAAGRRVALSLSDSFCVERHRDEFRDFVATHIDILFANEDEIVSLYRAADFDEAVRALPPRCTTAALTRGAKGSVIVDGGKVYEVAAAPVEMVLDTTGAGDLYAAGFLFGLGRGDTAPACARLGGIAAAEVISHVGARPRKELASLIP
ncbi:MAG: adenosine kinase [bacterium]|nr:adenosine kinase [bacterium]